MDFNYNSRDIENSINGLKAAFFDIFYRQEGSVTHLKEQMDKFDEVDRATADNLVTVQFQRLDRSMVLINEFINLVKQIDADSKRIENLYFGLETSMGSNEISKVAVNNDVTVANSVGDSTDNVASDGSFEFGIADDIVADGEKSVAGLENIDPMSVEMDTAPSPDIMMEISTEIAVENNTLENASEDVTTNENVSPEVSSDALNEDGKEYISGTPEEVNLDFFNMFKELPGMENIKLGPDGKPDFSEVLSKEVMEKAAKSGDTSLSGIAKIVAQENRDKNGIVEPVLPVIEANDQAIENNNVVADIIPVEVSGNEESTTVVAQEVDVTAGLVNENSSEPTSETVQVESVIVPTIAPPASPNEGFVNQAEVANEINVALNDINVSENATEPVIATESSTSEVSLPLENSINSELVVSGENTMVVQDTSVVESTLEQGSEVTTEAQTSIPESGLRRFIAGTSQPKAILVTEGQYGKLANSRVTQEALLKFKQILPDIGAPVTSAPVAPDLSNMSDGEKNKTIEAMMADANQLYNSGRVVEAQAMYEKISEINKTLVKS